MMDLAELKRLLERYRYSEDALELQALKVAAVNALPDLIAEIEMLREKSWTLTLQWELDHLRESDRHQRGRIERLEAALREIEAIEFGRGIEVAKQIARNAREFGLGQ